MERVAVIMGKMHSGGKKNLVMEYYRHIDRSRIQFDFICDDDSNAIPSEEIEELGGRVYIVPRYQRIFSNMKAIYRICKDNKYKIVHGYNGTMNIFGLFSAWCAGVPFRINESISMSHGSDKKNILKKLLRPFSRCFSTHYMANGNECGKWQFGSLFDLGKVSVFKTIINTEKNKFDANIREKCRHEYNLDEYIVVGHIGRLTAQKNTIFIIDIFNEFLKIEDKSKLIIIGDGDLKEEMMSRIKAYNIEDSVLYLGRREDIQQFYNAMDCFLLPSLYEGLPVVGIEAECCGLPVFFSTEIPKESSPCKDLGVFVGLEKNSSEWAKLIAWKIKETKRKDHSNEIKDAGFDSVNEAGNLLKYYEGLIK